MTKAVSRLSCIRIFARSAVNFGRSCSEFRIKIGNGMSKKTNATRSAANLAMTK